jgi:hypothetical protein
MTSDCWGPRLHGFKIRNFSKINLTAALWVNKQQIPEFGLPGGQMSPASHRSILHANKSSQLQNLQTIVRFRRLFTQCSCVNIHTVFCLFVFVWGGEHIRSTRSFHPSDRWPGSWAHGAHRIREGKSGQNIKRNIKHIQTIPK